MTTVVWFRNDLRTADNPALHDACAAAGQEAVVGIYLVSAAQHALHGEGPVRLAFVHEHVIELTAALGRLGIPLWVDRAPLFRDVPARLMHIIRALGARSLYFNAEYPHNEARRDAAVVQACAQAGVVCRVHHGDVILPPGSVRKDDGTPYSVYTPFRRRWQARLTPDDLEPLPEPRPRPERIRLSVRPPERVLEDLPPTDPHPDWPAGEPAARSRLETFLMRGLARYKAERDYPALDGTSRLSAWLNVGAISVRTCYALARAADRGEGAQAWLGELIWREFYRHVIAAFPHVSRGHAFRRELDDLPWRHDPEQLDAWKAGMTGYPLVDAGMRQLAATGFMHNRLRMLTAMFLTKHLLIDWHEGEKHFMATLRDADFASNNGGWQWSASTGTDAAPYFRIFNPETQAKKFDPDGAFVRHYIPELTDSRMPNTYPAPIVEHRAARERALRAFRRR